MSTASATPTTPVTPASVDEKTLLVEFEQQHMPQDYREYYAAKRHNFFASIEGFKELWELYLRLDSTMESVFFGDYDDRLKLDDTLMRMRRECDQVKEQIREMLKVRYKIEPPRGIHAPPRPTIVRP